MHQAKNMHALLNKKIFLRSKNDNWNYPENHEKQNNK